MRPVRYLFIVICLGLAACTSCGQGTDAETVVTLETSNGTSTFRVEIADTNQERSRGLMGRTDLEADQGMLFVWPNLVLNSFWMKDTPTSLDIIFIGADKTVQEIAADTTPNSEDLITPAEPYQYVLEVLAGTAADIGLEVGDSVTLPD